MQVETAGGRDALGPEEDRGPHAHRLVDDGIENGERALAIVCGCVCEELGAHGGEVRWVRGELHQDEGCGCRGCLAACGNDEARFAVEQVAALSGFGRRRNQV